MDADADSVIPEFADLVDGTVINLADLPTRNLSLEAVTEPTNVGSVRVSWNDVSVVQNTPPYALCGDTLGDFLPCAPAMFAPGEYQVTATAFSGADQGGTAGEPLSARVTVIDEAGPGPDDPLN